MGLYIAKEVCVNLGHEIEIESTVNEGTVVTVKMSISKGVS
nr:hypothetical protein [Clostridium tagluense]